MPQEERGGTREGEGKGRGWRGSEEEERRRRNGKGEWKRRGLGASTDENAYGNNRGGGNLQIQAYTE